VTAKSLAAGGGYRQPSLPGQPYATKYPPLFPLFLSLSWRVQPDFPRTLVVASIFSRLFAARVSGDFVLGSCGNWDYRAQNAAGGRDDVRVVSLSCFWAVTLYSELLFGCFLLSAIWATERAAVQDSARWALAGGLLTGLGVSYAQRGAADAGRSPDFFLPQKTAAVERVLLRMRAADGCRMACMDGNSRAHDGGLAVP